MLGTSILPRRFTFSLVSAARKIRKVFDNNLKARGMTLSRSRALFFLSSQTAMNQSELAIHLNIATASVVRIVDGLEQQGLLLRCPVEGDRRANKLQLTPEGAAQAHEVEAIAQNMRIRALEGISEADLAIGLKVLERMMANLDSEDFSDDRRN